MATQERKIEGNEKNLIELAKTQAALNELFGKIGAGMARADSFKAQATSEELQAELLRNQARVLSADKNVILEALGAPSNLQGFEVDHDKGVYRWTEREHKPAVKLAE